MPTRKVNQNKTKTRKLKNLQPKLGKSRAVQVRGGGAAATDKYQETAKGMIQSIGR